LNDAAHAQMMPRSSSTTDHMMEPAMVSEGRLECLTNDEEATSYKSRQLYSLNRSNVQCE
jgi:hypothetical protein